MKAPDVIYLPESDKVKGEVSANFASENPFKMHTSIAYIRKDALLEWLNAKLSFALNINCEEDNYEAGTADAYQEVINKLNSM